MSMKSLKKNQTKLCILSLTIVLIVAIIAFGIIPAYTADTDGDGIPDYLDPDPYTPEDWDDDGPPDDDDDDDGFDGWLVIRGYAQQYDPLFPGTEGNPVRTDWSADEVTVDFEDGFQGLNEDDTYPPYDWELTVWRWEDGSMSEYPEGGDGLLYYNFATDAWQADFYSLQGTWDAGEPELVVEENVSVLAAEPGDWVMGDFWVYNNDGDCWHTVATQV